jgi:hypothetical protein
LSFAIAKADVITGGDDVITGGNVRVDFNGSMSPRTLLRARPQPISVRVRGAVKPVGENRPPALEKIVIEFNRHARLTTRGYPTCRQRSLRATTTRQALAVCGDALVGSGHFEAHIDIPDQAPFPASGRALIFNGEFHGRPALLGHVYGPRPQQTTEVVPFILGRSRQATFGTTLSARMPEVGADWGYVTGFDLALGHSYRFQGQTFNLLTASCPAPQGFSEVPFRLARGTFYLADGGVRSRVLSSSCEVRQPAPRRASHQPAQG